VEAPALDEEPIMTIFESALQLLHDGDVVGLGSGRTTAAFIRLLGERVAAGLRVRGVPTSSAAEEVARSAGVPLTSLDEALPLALTIDGADEVAPNLDLIKGYGRALVREKVVAASSRRLVILAGRDKEVPALGARGKLPVEVIPFALPLCRRRLTELDLEPTLYEQDGRIFVTDNGNHILDCAVGAIADPARLEANLRAIPGVVGTGLFLGLADTVLIGDETDGFRLVAEKHRP
jgi:ribose 5-phosphate isomerase A